MADVLRSKDNPVIFFDLHSNKQKIGRLTIQLFHDICPKTSQNFRQFCTGEYLHNGKPIGYKQTCLHKIVEQKYFQGGDFITNGVNSKPKMSIYGGDNALFQDQNYEIKHNQAGLLSMINLGMKNGNGNLWRISAGPCPELEERSMVFGKVTDEQSLKVVKIVSSLAVGQNYRPKHPVIIRQCGQM